MNKILTFLTLICLTLCINSQAKEPMPTVSQMKEVTGHLKYETDLGTMQSTEHWANLIGIARNISEQRAMDIADKDPKITFFFYTRAKLWLGDLPVPAKGQTDRDYILPARTAVFFSGKPSWESSEDRVIYPKKTGFARFAGDAAYSDIRYTTGYTKVSK